MTAPDAILKGILEELSKVAEQERAEVFATVLVELLNAGAVPMDGDTLQSPLSAAPDAVNKISQLLGVRPTPTRNKYSIYPFARPSVSSSGPCYYIDAKTGELMLLLLRRIKDDYQWVYPAGYMELLPPNTELLYRERASESARNQAEEATMGVEFSVAAEQKEDKSMPGSVVLPRPRPLRQLVSDEFKRLLTLERWDVVFGKLAQSDYLIDLFHRHAIHWPAYIDLNSRSTFVRETREEAGLDLAAYPDAVIKRARSLDAAVSSGSVRIYNVDQLYFGYLGVQAHPPVISFSTSEAVEVAWLRVSELYRDPERNQYVVSKDGRPMHFNAIQGIEYTLLGLLDYLIEQVSKVSKPRSDEVVPRFSNAASIQAALIEAANGSYNAINELVDHSIGADKTLPSLLHQSGQAIFRSFVAAAKGLAKGTKEDALEHIIADAKERPSALIELLR